jgi:hypothetical protein
MICPLQHVGKNASRWVASLCLGGAMLAVFAAIVASQTLLFGVGVGPAHVREVLPGQAVRYDHVLTNTGALTDTFWVEVTSTQGWPVALSELLYPTDTVVLPPGTAWLPLMVGPHMTASFQLSLTVPVTAAGVVESTRITATSHTSPTVQDATTDTSIVRHRLYLPLLFRRWPPLPYQPTIDVISGAQDGYYMVSWDEPPVRLASTYVLEEATDVIFLEGVRQVCTTAEQDCDVPRRPPGFTYYYRVRGQNVWGYGEWSNPRAVYVPYLREQVTLVTVALPRPLAARERNWCTWTWCSLSPRLYHEALDDDRTLAGWTDSSGDGHVSVVGSDGSLDQTYDFPDLSVRGMVAHDDGTFAILLWDSDARIMWLSKRSTDGTGIWWANVDGDMTHFNPEVGDSRLTYGNGLYVAYFAVHGDTGWPAGHEGDQLTYVSGEGVIQPGGWEWGCSHSMAELVSYHPVLDAFAPVCSSDCYASKGILINDDRVVYPCDGNCGGLVSAQLGQIALGGDAWKLVFSALDRPGYVGKGIGLATIDGSFGSDYVWLTDTGGEYERDPVIARLGRDLESDRYVVGWRTTDDGVYWLGVIDGDGRFWFGPEEVSSAGIGWGNRDDSFRTRTDGSVSWVQGDAGSATLHLFRFDGSAFVLQ